jgi:adenosylhomocysteinase
MDMSFATQALASSWVVSGVKLEVKVHDVPQDLVDDVASLKLAAMGITIDELTPEQKHYLASWEVGT